MQKTNEVQVFKAKSFFKNFKFIKAVKHQSLGDCKLMKNKTNGSNCLVRELILKNLTVLENLKPELGKLSTLNKNNSFLKMIAIADNSAEKKLEVSLFLVYENIDYDLEREIIAKAKSDEHFDENFLWKFIYDISMALEELSKMEYSHSDIRACTIALVKSQTNLIDRFVLCFGFERLSSYSAVLSSIANFAKYNLSPEELIALNNFEKEPRYNKNKSDVFSLGLLVLRLCSIRHYESFYFADRPEIDQRSIQKKMELVKSLYSENLVYIIKKMLVFIPDNRPSFSEIYLYARPFLSRKTSNLRVSTKNPQANMVKPVSNPPMVKFSNDLVIKKLQDQESKTKPYLPDDDNLLKFRESYFNEVEVSSKGHEEEEPDQIEPLHDSSNRISFEALERFSNLKKQNSLATPTFRDVNSFRRSDSVREREAPEVNVKLSLDKEIFHTNPPQRSEGSLSEFVSTTPLMIEPSKYKPKLQELEMKIILTEEGEYKPSLIKICYKDGSVYIGGVKEENLREGEGIYYYLNKDVYAGEWKDDKFHGKGLYIFHNGDFFEGSLENGERSGRGYYIYNTGNKYEGEWKHNKKEGFGILRYHSTGERYEGEWKGGEKEGDGIYYFANGDKFVGKWIYGQKAGTGIVYFHDGGKFQGEWYENEPTGFGILRFSNGDTYQGLFKKGNKDGNGIYTHEVGARYEGEWKEDEIRGQGVYYYLNGDRYFGEFLNSLRHGYGEYFYSSGDVYRGQWKLNKKNGKGSIEHTDGSRFEGLFVDGWKEGQGFMIYENGDKFEGMWSMDKKNGEGTYYWNTEGFYEGQWLEDEMHGYGIYMDAEGVKFEGEWNHNKFTV